MTPVRDWSRCVPGHNISECVKVSGEHGDMVESRYNIICHIIQGVTVLDLTLEPFISPHRLYYLTIDGNKFFISNYGSNTLGPELYITVGQPVCYL